MLEPGIFALSQPKEQVVTALPPTIKLLSRSGQVMLQCHLSLLPSHNYLLSHMVFKRVVYSFAVHLFDILFVVARLIA
jgi:hypothetical protein